MYAASSQNTYTNSVPARRSPSLVRYPSPPQVVYAIAAGSYSPIPDEVNPFFKGLIEQMLTVDPDARPSISQMHKLVQKKWGSPELWDNLNMNAGKSYADVYEEIRPLGKGQFGIVMLVRRRADSALLAVKKVCLLVCQGGKGATPVYGPNDLHGTITNMTMTRGAGSRVNITHKRVPGSQDPTQMERAIIHPHMCTCDVYIL